MKKYYTEEEAVAAAKDSVVEFIDFVGQNCNDYLDEGEDECLGWDGEDRRCFCGNRRVCWETYKENDGSFTACAVAY